MMRKKVLCILSSFSYLEKLENNTENVTILSGRMEADISQIYYVPIVNDIEASTDVFS